MTTMLDHITEARSFALREWQQLAPVDRRNLATTESIIRPLVEQEARTRGWPQTAVSNAVAQVLQRAFFAHEAWQDELDAMAAEYEAERADDLAAARDDREDRPW